MKIIVGIILAVVVFSYAPQLGVIVGLLCIWAIVFKLFLRPILSAPKSISDKAGKETRRGLGKLFGINPLETFFDELEEDRRRNRKRRW